MIAGINMLLVGGADIPYSPIDELLIFDSKQYSVFGGVAYIIDLGRTSGSYTSDASYELLDELVPAGYTKVTFLENRLEPNGTMSSDIRYSPDVDVIKVPDCRYVHIKAWGGGGGSGGAWRSGNPGRGGCGGYCYTRLAVGSDVQVGDYIYLSPGIQGLGGSDNWYSGGGGGGSCCWLSSSYKSNLSDRLNLLNASSCILSAGGGGGGSAIGWSSGTAGHGGPGGSLNSGSGYNYNGNGTGATSSAHGTAPSVPYGENSFYGAFDGGEYDGDTNAYPGFHPACLLPNHNETFYNDTHYSQGKYFTPAGGGGGSYRGATGYGSAGGSHRFGCGGGGGANAVYKGTPMAVQSRSAGGATPYNSGESGGCGYGGNGKGALVETDRYAGLNGTGGRITVRFSDSA